MLIPESEVVAVLKEQIEISNQKLADKGFDETLVRERVVHLACQSRGPVIGVGTGTRACMAAALAQNGLAVTAIDNSHCSVRIAQKRAAGDLKGKLDIRFADANRLPFPDKSYREAVAFDTLCHASDPPAILEEMFRVSSDMVVITELNDAGRRVTQHEDGFDAKLPDLLSKHCHNCQQFDDPHHVTFVCGGTYESDH